jgi:integrase
VNSIPVSPSADSAQALDRFMAAQGFDANARAAAIAALAATTAPAGVPWEKFRAELLEQYGPALRSKSTRRSMVHAMSVLESLGVTTTADLDCRLLTRLVTTRDPALSPNSVRNLLRRVQCVCSHAVNFGYLDVSPFIKRPIRTWCRGSKPKGVKHLTRVQIRAILDVAAADVADKRGWALYRARRLEALVTLSCFTGLRSGELLWCQVEDLDLVHGVVNVVSRATHRTKNESSEKPVPLLPVAVKVLREWLTHRMDAPDGVDRDPSLYLFPNVRNSAPWLYGPVGCKPLDRLKALAKRAGVEQASWQMIRRSVATHLEGAGCGPAMIQRILRHSHVGTTQQFYMKADLENMHRAMKDFGY